MIFRCARKLIICAFAVLLFTNWIALAQDDDKHPPAHAGAGVPVNPDVKPDSVPPLLLGELIEQALAHNPEIKAMRRSFDRVKARVPQAKALPDPMLEAGYIGNVVPVPPFDIQKGDPSSARMLSLSQEIPFPGKRSLKGRIADADAQTEWWGFEQTRLNVVAEVKDAYFELYYITRAVETLAKNKGLLEKFSKISEARYSVGKGIQQDVLKAQVEISKLTDQLLVLEQRKQTAEARINSLLYRNPDYALGKPEEIKPRPFKQVLGELNELALANYPTLKAQRRRIDREQYAVELAEKELYPDFTVRLNYQNRPGMPDMYGVSVGVNIPIFAGQKQRPAIAEAAASRAMEEKRLQSAITLLLYRVKEKYLAATTAERLISLYGTTIIPQSSLSLESAIAGYEVGKVDFLTLIDNLMTLLNYQLSYYEQVSNAERAIAQLEPLVGVTLRP